MTAIAITLFAIPASQADQARASESSSARGVLSRGVPVGGAHCPPNAKRVPGGCVPRGAVHVIHGERCKSARKAVSYFRALTWERQEARDAELADRTPVVRSKTCRWARFAADEWQARARSAKRSLVRWVVTRTLRDFDASPGNQAWRRAVREAQRAYPGTEAWLLSCSASEGGHGRWVPNSQGSGVGGWLQMFPSTFWRMFTAARADVQARGFRVPSSAASWYSPLGQALGGAWAVLNGRRHEWVGHGC